MPLYVRPSFTRCAASGLLSPTMRSLRPFAIHLNADATVQSHLAALALSGACRSLLVSSSASSSLRAPRQVFQTPEAPCHRRRGASGDWSTKIWWDGSSRRMSEANHAGLEHESARICLAFAPRPMVSRDGPFSTKSLHSTIEPLLLARHNVP